MRAGDLEAAKSFALKLWEMEKQFMRIAPSSKDRYLVKELVRLEDKPVEHRTEGEQWEIERINEQLAETPPYRKQARPVGPIQPLRTPRSLEERQLQMEPHIRASNRALEALLKEYGAVPGTTFTIVDGAAATAARFPKPQQPKPNVFVRFGRWVKGLFTRKPKQLDPSKLEVLDPEVLRALKEADPDPIGPFKLKD